MCKKILALFPPHRTYVEPFGGAGTLLINKEPSAVEIYNDKNDYMVDLMRVIRDYNLLKRFLRIARLIPHSRAEYYKFCEDIKTDKYNRDSECVWLNFDPRNQETICQVGNSLFLVNQ